MVLIRLASKTDADAVLELAAELATSFVVEPNAFYTSFTNIIYDTNAYLAVAEIEGLLVGYVLGFIHSAFYANGLVGWVEEIIVVPAHRRQGIGRMLMLHFEQWAKEHHCQLVSLATRRAS